MNDTTIKFYANYKKGRYFISGKNEKNKYYSLWKSQEFNTDMYLDTDLFKGGLEIEKTKLKLLKREDGEESKVLVFKNADDEVGLCITKEEIEKRKKQKETKNNSSCFTYVIDLFKDLFNANKDLKIGEFLKAEIENNQAPVDTTETDEDLPF